MNSFERALRNKKRFGCLLLAFDELYGKDFVDDFMIQGIMSSIDTKNTRDLIHIANDFSQVKDLSVIASVPEDGDYFNVKYFDVNKHFPIAMNTPDTVAVLFGEDFCVSVLGYDIKHNLYIIKFETVEDVPLDLIAYPQEGSNAFVVKAEELESFKFGACAIFMRRPKVMPFSNPEIPD